MHVVEQDEGGGGDRADAPGAQADPAQGLESGLEQRIAAFGECSGGRVQSVDRALIVAQGSPAGRMSLMARSSRRSPLTQGSPCGTSRLPGRSGSYIGEGADLNCQVLVDC